MRYLSPRRATWLIAFLMSGTPAFCQSDSLTLSSDTTTPGGTVSLNLSLRAPSGSHPAGVEWTFAYSPSDVVAISATEGVAATAAGKSLLCTGTAGSYVCFLTGMSSGGLNANIIRNGVVAVLTVTLSAATTQTTINVTNPLSTLASGRAIPTTATGGTITTAIGLTSLNCSPDILAPGVSTSCTVTLNQAASSATTVTLADSNALLTVPAGVTVPAGATSATFTASAGNFTANQSVTVTATLNGASKTAYLILLDTPALSSLSCNPSSLTSGSSATCTVKLSREVYILRNVQLRTNSSLLIIPTSVSVAAWTSSATFTATAGSITTSQSVTLTASLDNHGLNSSI